MSVFFIAEAGVNHNSSIALAKELIDAASDAGADAVKFQTFTAETLLTKDAEKASYQLLTTQKSESQYDMIRSLELDYEAHKTLIEYCNLKNIRFLSTPFDIKSLKMLVRQLCLKTIKIPSGELTNGPFLLQAAKMGKKVILSTGMSNLNEIERALKIINFGFERPQSEFNFSHAEDLYSEIRSSSSLRKRVTLLHCTTEYPAPPSEVNLKAMQTMKKKFGLDVGYSDHTEGIHIPIAAVAMGATLIEKHFTIDRSLPGPDHKASIEPHQLKSLINNIKELEVAFGDGEKTPTKSELKNIPIIRKSLVATTQIKKGEKFTEENITTKRPGSGKSPMEYWDLIGQTSSRNYSNGDLIE